MSRWIVIISVLFNWTRNQTLARTTFPPSREKTFVSNMFNTAWQRENSLLTQHSRDDYILCLPLNTFATDLSANRMMHDVFELLNQFVASLFLTQSIPVDFQITLDVRREKTVARFSLKRSIKSSQISARIDWEPRVYLVDMERCNTSNGGCWHEYHLTLINISWEERMSFSPAWLRLMSE